MRSEDLRAASTLICVKPYPHKKPQNKKIVGSKSKRHDPEIPIIGWIKFRSYLGTKFRLQIGWPAQLVKTGLVGCGFALPTQLDQETGQPLPCLIMDGLEDVALQPGSAFLQDAPDLILRRSDRHFFFEKWAVSPPLAPV